MTTYTTRAIQELRRIERIYTIEFVKRFNSDLRIWSNMHPDTEITAGMVQDFERQALDSFVGRSTKLAMYELCKIEGTL